ncbi:MAG: RnfABCDGE type electron transport complex subunit G [Cyclobacteriaceae bacterium]|jgi:electron transport complex protein RnfG|nr:RnfABCDGE type electron transport complex subunit G [Cyclobacteriaceae bacterium]
MASIKSTFGNLILTLGVITLVASLSLGYVYQWTKEPIAEAQLAKQLKAIQSVVQGYDNNPVNEVYKVVTVDGTDSLEFFPAKKGNELIGMAIKSKSAKGYSGDIFIMVGFNMKGDILNVSVIEHKETPGLGSKMTSPGFVNQFIGKNPGEMKFKVKKDGGELDAITGATISSRAYSEAIALAYDTFKSTLSDGTGNQ